MCRLRQIINKTFSTLNIQSEFITDPLTNNGKGRNYGIELTLEKYLDNNLYYTVNGSLYQSKYTAADGVERNTRYHANYLFLMRWQERNSLIRSAQGVGYKFQGHLYGRLPHNAHRPAGIHNRKVTPFLKRKKHSVCKTRLISVLIVALV